MLPFLLHLPNKGQVLVSLWLSTLVTYNVAVLFGEDSTGLYIELLDTVSKTHQGGLHQCKTSTKSLKQYVAMKISTSTINWSGTWEAIPAEATENAFYFRPLSGNPPKFAIWKNNSGEGCTQWSRPQCTSSNVQERVRLTANPGGHGLQKPSSIQKYVHWMWKENQRLPFATSQET